MTNGGGRLEVVVPGLVVLVGAAGAGKSTLAARLFAPADILSSDALRAAVSGDQSDQRATRPAFSILHREVRNRLAAGRLVVVDATNVERAARIGLVRLAFQAGVPATALVILGDPLDVHARNAARTGRVVPRDVVDRQLGQLHRVGATASEVAATLRLEGFDAAHVVRSGEDVTEVVVVPRPESRGR